MLHSYHLNGPRRLLGQAVPSLFDLIRSKMRRPLSGLGYAGLGAPTSDWAAFMANLSKTAVYIDADRQVYCTKDTSSRPQCVLNQAPPADKECIRGLQQAIDEMINLIPTRNLAGREFVAQVPTGDGGTTERRFTIDPAQPNPLGSGRGGGYDGIVGDTTMLFGATALTLAAMLKEFPQDAQGVALARVFVGLPDRNDLMATYCSEVARFLRDVVRNFDSLLAAYEDRGRVPAQDQLSPETIEPFLVPKVAAKRSNTGVIVGLGLGLLGVTVAASYAATRAKSASDADALEVPPSSLGRGRYPRMRRWSL